MRRYNVVHSALPARLLVDDTHAGFSPLRRWLLVDDTHAYILTDCEGGNPVSAPAVGGS